MNLALQRAVHGIWKNDAELNNVQAKLLRLRFDSFDDVVAQLLPLKGGCIINRRLREIGESALGTRSIFLLRQRLLFHNMKRIMRFPPFDARGTQHDVHVVFTAPHNLPLFREGCAIHKNEEYTSFLAKTWANQGHGARLCWSRSERERCGRIPRPENIDPNYLLESDLPSNPWFISLQELRAKSENVPLLHVDIHGCINGPPDTPEMVLGLGPLEAANAAKAKAFRAALVRRLEEPLARYAPHRALESRPEGRFTAICVDPERLTLTQQSIRLNYEYAVQVELSLSLRCALFKDPVLRKDVGEAFVRAVRDAIAEDA